MTLAVHVVRLAPGADLLDALARLPGEAGFAAGFVLAAVGSLRPAVLRHAGCAESTIHDGDLELITLSGTLSPDGPHLHMSVSDAHGRVAGGHVMPGCIVRTTAEIVVGASDAWRFGREHDPATGYRELVAERTANLAPRGSA